MTEIPIDFRNRTLYAEKHFFCFCFVQRTLVVLVVSVRAHAGTGGWSFARDSPLRGSRGARWPPCLLRTTPAHAVFESARLLLSAASVIHASSPLRSAQALQTQAAPTRRTHCPVPTPHRPVREEWWSRRLSCAAPAPGTSREQVHQSLLHEGYPPPQPPISATAPLASSPSAPVVATLVAEPRGQRVLSQRYHARPSSAYRVEDVNDTRCCRTPPSAASTNVGRCRLEALLPAKCRRCAYVRAAKTL